MVLTYTDCKELIKRGRGGRKKLRNNTYLYLNETGDFEVVLHSTAVVTIHQDGMYTLNSGGWRTVTTKKIINMFSPVKVYQQNFEWYMGTTKVPFRDDIKVCGTTKLIVVAL